MPEHENGSPASQWYYAADRKKCGPVSLAQLQGLAAEGRLTPADMVLQDGMTRWQPASSVTGLFPVAPPAPEATLVLPTAAARPVVGEGSQTVQELPRRF